MNTREREVMSMSRHSRAMLLNVLWHHHGGSSAVGQPIRALLGIGEHDPLTDEQVAEAKWIDALLAEGSASSEGAEAVYQVRANCYPVEIAPWREVSKDQFEGKDGAYPPAAYDRRILYTNQQPAQGEPAKKDRDFDRARFPDAAFNRWLDDGISDAGHTVYDSLGSVFDAWQGWEAREYYGQKTAQGAHEQRSCEGSEAVAPFAQVHEIVATYTNPQPAHGEQCSALEVFRIAGGDVECTPNPTAAVAMDCLRDLRECYDEALSEANRRESRRSSEGPERRPIAESDVSRACEVFDAATFYSVGGYTFDDYRKRMRAALESAIPRGLPAGSDAYSTPMPSTHSTPTPDTGTHFPYQCDNCGKTVHAHLAPSYLCPTATPAASAEQDARDAVRELIEAAQPISNYQWPNEKEWNRFHAAVAAIAAQQRKGGEK